LISAVDGGKRSAGRSPKSIWTLWGREKSLALTGNRTLAVQPITMLTKLSRVQFKIIIQFNSLFIYVLSPTANGQLQSQHEYKQQKLQQKKQQNKEQLIS
jgi:hypothetical protein